MHTYFTSSTSTAITKAALVPPLKSQVLNCFWVMLVSSMDSVHLVSPPITKPWCQPSNAKLSLYVETEIYTTEQTNVQRQIRILSYFLVPFYCWQTILSIASVRNHTMAVANTGPHFMPYTLQRYLNF